MALQAALAAAGRRRASRLADLRDWLAIPSVSADPACTGELRRAARWLAGWQAARGARVWLRPTATGRDVVVARWPGPPGAPVVVLYGHYDVQPPGPGWTSDPFGPAVRGGRLYARGAGDDKGQLFAHLSALDAWRAAGGPPVEVVVVAEGAEEVGSPGFDRVAGQLARRLRPRAVVVSDTERDGSGAPTVTVSQRGQLAADLEVDTGGSALHPGRFGGAVADAALVLADALGALRDGLGAHPAALPADPPGLRRRTDAAVAAAAGGRAVTGTGLDRRITRRASVGVTRITGGGLGGALPARASARVDVRLPPGTDPARALARGRRLVAGTAPPGVAVRLRLVSGARGLELPTSAATRRAVDQACRVGFGRPPAYVRSGGTIPAVGMLARAFRLPPLLLGFAPAGSRAHGPDEALDLGGWAAAVDTSAALLAELARPIPHSCVSAGPEIDNVAQARPVVSANPMVPTDGEELWP